MFEYIIGLLGLLRAYRGAYFFLIKRRIKGPAPIMVGAEPFFIRRPGKKVALMIHGFTSSPKEFRRMGNTLARQGISVCAPLLPGHGTSPERLSIVKYNQWLEFIEEQIKMLEKDYDSIYLVGNSFGGNLALLSHNCSKKIKIRISTPLT